MFKRTEVIGRGKFGIVYKGINKQTRQVVAIKVLNLDTQEDEVAEVQQEIQFLAELKQVPNVIHYHGSFLNDTRLWIVMDYSAGGSIATLLRAGVFEEKYIAVVLRELAIALQGIHNMGVIHRDMKAANFLIDNEGNVLLCDFGVAARLQSRSHKRMTMAGTPYWMAPEVIREGEHYNLKADIWSLGISLYEMATGNPPYCDKGAAWAMQMISKLTPPRLEGREYSSILKESIALCLDESPAERPLADDLLKCKLVKQYKQLPATVMKEVISRYLIWRDHLQKDSPNTHAVDDDVQSIAESNHMQVKWDFDSLSSKEYIVENDLNDPDDEENSREDDDTDTYPTLHFNGSQVNEEQTIGANDTKKPSGSRSATKSAPKNDIPKSLTQLFEDTDESNNDGMVTDLPPLPSFKDKTESPTIEIPDMDNLSNYKKAGTHSTTNVAGQPSLSKPPALYHSQSASGSLESKYNQATSNSRRVKVTNDVVNSLMVPPRSPPDVQNNHTIRTPSPVSLNTPVTLHSLQNGGNHSPSKSMKALQANKNPLLQPINPKTGDINNTNPSSQIHLSQLLNEQQPTSGQPVAAKRGKRPRPGLFIQMPKPSNTYSTMPAFTNDQEHSGDGEEGNVNQFGINPAHAASVPLAMTPVTEKESFNPPFSVDNTESESESKSISAQRNASVPQLHVNTFQRSQSTSSIPDASNHVPKLNFPDIPQINNEFFSDSTPKANLVGELDLMIKLFSQGLEALEELL